MPGMNGLEAMRADLVRIAAAVLRDPVGAEDVAQEALLRLTLEEGPVVRPDAWLRRVARNLAIDRLRRRAHDSPEPLGDVPVESEVPAEGTALVASWLPAFVEALDEPYRTAIRRVDLEGIGQAELARELGISTSGARTRVQRGRRLLHEHVLACCPVRFEAGEVVDTGIDRCRCVQPG